MNPFAALITGLPSAETAARPGAPGGSPFGGGLFARLLEGESTETDAAANPLLASLGTLNTLPVIQANAPLPGLPVPQAGGQAPDAGALPLPLPQPGTAPI
ncbi:MAG: hypothetical protein D6773_17305, partial [Alphaproteobacteria bacterium]